MGSRNKKRRRKNPPPKPPKSEPPASAVVEPPQRSPAAGNSPRWRRLAGLTLMVLLCLVYLDWRVMPNQSSRALPVLSMVEHGELNIDRYHEITEDKAKVGEHYYSEKAPLSSMLVLPFYAAAAPLMKGQDPEVRLRVVISLGAVVCGTLPFLFCLLWSVRRCRAAGGANHGDLLAALSYLGTFTFVYAGTYFGHLLAGLLLTFTYSLLWERERPMLAGLVLGVACLAEYPAIVAAPVWGAQLLLRGRGVKSAALLAAGLVPGLALTAAYNMVITGNPLDFPYSHVGHAVFAGSQKQFGIGAPSLEAFLGLTLGPRRGLFIYSPLLLWFAWRAMRGASRAVGPRGQALCVARSPVAGLGLAMVLFFSCYYMWWGGWAYGPRHLIPLVLVWLHAALPGIAAGRKVSWLTVAPLAGAGLLLNWAANATHGYLIPETHAFPAVSPLLADLFGGNWSFFNVLSGYFGVSPRLVNGAWPLVAGAVVWLLRPVRASRK